MRIRLSRRKLLKDSAIVAGVAVGAQVLGVPALLAQRSPNSKLGMALIGANGRGWPTRQWRLPRGSWPWWT